MITNQESYTVSDEYERECSTPHLPSENLKRSFEQSYLEPCHQIMEWEDSLEERPIIFRIREYTNNEDNSCTVSTIEFVNKPICFVIFSITQSKFAPKTTHPWATGAFPVVTANSASCITPYESWPPAVIHNFTKDLDICWRTRPSLITKKLPKHELPKMGR